MVIPPAIRKRTAPKRRGFWGPDSAASRQDATEGNNFRRDEASEGRAPFVGIRAERKEEKEVEGPHSSNGRGGKGSLACQIMHRARRRRAEAPQLTAAGLAKPDETPPNYQPECSSMNRGPSLEMAFICSPYSRTTLSARAFQKTCRMPQGQRIFVPQ